MTSKTPAGSEEAIITRPTEATEDLNGLVEHHIESRLVPTKAAVVASSDRLARKLRAVLGELAGTPAEVTEALGIDFASARPRRDFAGKSKILARIRATAKRRARFKVMAKFGGKITEKLVKQGANPAAMYGVAVRGFNKEMITQVPRTADCGAPPYASGRSLDITLQLADLDPGPDATGAPLIRWAQEVWQTILYVALTQAQA